MIARQPIPKYDRYQREIAECQRLGLGYVATEPTSHLVLLADDLKRAGHLQAAEQCRAAATLSAISQAVAISAARRGHIRMKPKKVRA
jgi:hypothetical protein